VFNLLEQEAAKELLSLSHQKGIGIIARVPLARGLLTQKMAVQTGPPINRNRLRIAKANIEQLSLLLNEKMRTLPQTAIRFVLHHPQVSVVIPGTRTVKHLEENATTLWVPPLTKEELEKLTLLFSS